MRTILAAGTAVSALLLAGAAWAGALGAGTPGTGTPGAGTSDDMPPNAVPGHCYQRVTTPSVTETYQERVIDIPEHAATRTIPPVYGEVDRKVMVREGRVEHVLIPPTYRTVTETEVIRPEISRTEVIPAEYERVTERILIHEAHAEWRRDYGPVSDPDMPRRPSDRDIVCLIEVPAEYRLDTRDVLRAPERVVHTTIPAEVRTRTREVIDQPAHEERREIAPIYSTVHERVVVQPERVETYTVPPVYRIVTRTRAVTPDQAEWREVECRKVGRPHHRHDEDSDGERGALEPSTRPDVLHHPRVLAEDGRGEHGVAADGSIARLQSALAQRGYYSGPIDGLFTIPTGDAMTRFQRDHDLPLGGFNFATAQALKLQ